MLISHRRAQCSEKNSKDHTETLLWYNLELDSVPWCQISIAGSRVLFEESTTSSCYKPQSFTTVPSEVATPSRFNAQLLAVSWLTMNLPTARQDRPSLPLTKCGLPTRDRTQWSSQPCRTLQWHRGLMLSTSTDACMYLIHIENSICHWRLHVSKHLCYSGFI